MTKQEHRDAIASAIAAAEADGHVVEITNDCCGCSRMTLRINETYLPGDDYRAYERGAVEIFGEA